VRYRWYGGRGRSCRGDCTLSGWSWLSRWGCLWCWGRGLFFLATGVVVEPEGSSKCAVLGRNGDGLALLLDRRGKGRLLIFCYARRTRTLRGTIRLKGGAHEETQRPWYEVLGFLCCKRWILRGQDDRSWTMKYARLRRSKVKTKVQRWFLKYLATRNRRTRRNTMESYE
jgi:hypothetical protein